MSTTLLTRKQLKTVLERSNISAPIPTKKTPYTHVCRPGFPYVQITWTDKASPDGARLFAWELS